MKGILKGKRDQGIIHAGSPALLLFVSIGQLYELHPIRIVRLECMGQQAGGVLVAAASHAQVHLVQNGDVCVLQLWSRLQLESDQQP